METVSLVLSVVGVVLLLWIIALLKKIQKKLEKVTRDTVKIASAQAGDEDNGGGGVDPAHV